MNENSIFGNSQFSFHLLAVKTLFSEGSGHRDHDIQNEVNIVPNGDAERWDHDIRNWKREYAQSLQGKHTLRTPYALYTQFTQYALYALHTLYTV